MSHEEIFKKQHFKRSDKMKMNAPKWVTWLVSLIIGCVGILVHLGVLKLSFLAGYGFWLVVIAFGLLILATLFKNL